MTTETKIERDPWQELRKPFPAAAVSKLPKGGVTLDYVGHAAVTDRLLSVDKNWNWEPLALTPEGLPLVRSGPKELELWIRITILGKTMVAVGTCAPGAFEAGKQLISDALRNGAMRFGVALDLWSKDELESTLPPEGASKAQRTTGEVRGPQPQPPAQAQRQAQPQTQATGGYMDLVNSVDISAGRPVTRDDAGNLLLWGVPVPATVYDGWQKWAKYPVVEEGKTEAQKARVEAMRQKEATTGKQNPMLHNTWATMAEGSAGGSRETVLRWMVAKAAEKAAKGEKLYADDHRAAVCLDEMLRLRAAAGDPGAPF